MSTVRARRKAPKTKRIKLRPSSNGRLMTVEAPVEPAEVVIPTDGSYRTPLLPGFELPLAQLLKLADDWAPPAPKKTPPQSADPT